MRGAHPARAPGDSTREKRKDIIRSDEEEDDDDIQDLSPPRKKMKSRMKTTPVNGRGSRDDPKPRTSSRTKDVKVKAPRKRKPAQTEEDEPESEEPVRRRKPARAEEPNRAEEDDRAEEPIRVAVEEVSVLAEPEGAFLQPIRDAIEAVERRYRPLRVAMRGVGTALRSTAVGEYPDMVRKLKKEAGPNRKELDKSRTETSKLAILALDQKEEIARQKETIRALEQQDRTTLKALEKLFQPDGEVQTKARLWDEKVAEPGTDGAARAKEVVKEYAAKVEETLKDFRKLIAAVLARCPSGRSTGKWGGQPEGRGAPLASSEMLAHFHFSQDAPRTGDMDRMMGAEAFYSGTDFTTGEKFGSGLGGRPAGGELGRAGESGGGGGGNRHPTG